MSTLSRWLARTVLVGSIGLLPLSGVAENVASFTSATIEQYAPPGGAPLPLDLDPNSPPNDATYFSIPPGGVARIRVTGVTAGAGAAAIHAMDQDATWDDQLDLQGTGVLGAGQPFEIDVYLMCGTPSAEVIGSGEQSAEIYIRDGDKRIPASQDLGGGWTRLSWWRIDCDKQTTQPLGVAGGTIHAFWGDSLQVPAGALGSPVDVQMANMYPLLHTDAVPPGSLDISEAQALEPDGLALATPATLTFHYTHEEAGENADETTLKIYRYEPLTQQWLPVPGEIVDPVNDLISVPISVFGTYGFAAAAPAVPAFPGRGVVVATVLVALLATAGLARARQLRLRG